MKTMSLPVVSVLVVMALFSCASRPIIAATTAQEKEPQPMLVSVKRLSMDSALKIAQATISSCRKAGVQVSVVVLDRNGNEQVVLRDVLASSLTMEIAKKKATAALLFNQPSSAMHGRFPDYSIPKLNSLLIEGGAVPINAGGTILGAVGVSGAPSPTTDESCAKAGHDAIIDDLEMAGE